VRWSFSVQVEALFGLHVQGRVFTAAGGRDVQRFAGEGVIDEDVGGVDGAALSAGGRGGVGQLNVGGDIVRGQPDAPGPSRGEGTTGSGHGEVAVVVVSGDGPGVAVLDEAGCSLVGEPPVVSAGDDVVSDAGTGSVLEIDSGFGDGAGAFRSVWGEAVTGGGVGVLDEPLLGVEEVLGGVPGRAVLDQQVLPADPPVVVTGAGRGGDIGGIGDIGDVGDLWLGLEAVRGELDRVVRVQRAVEDQPGGGLPARRDRRTAAVAAAARSRR